MVWDDDPEWRGRAGGGRTRALFGGAATNLLRASVRTTVVKGDHVFGFEFDDAPSSRVLWPAFASWD